MRCLYCPAGCTARKNEVGLKCHEFLRECLQRQEARREQIPIANLLRRHAGETVPRRSCGELYAEVWLVITLSTNCAPSGRRSGQFDQRSLGGVVKNQGCPYMVPTSSI